MSYTYIQVQYLLNVHKFTRIVCFQRDNSEMYYLFNSVKLKSVHLPP